MTETMTQTAPFPTILAELVTQVSYRPGWTVGLENRDRGQGSKGLTLSIYVRGLDSYNANKTINVVHYMLVPPAAFDRRSWTHWLFEQFLLVERHECMEFFKIGKKRPFAPHHGPGNDPYIVFDHGTSLDTRTMYTGEVKEPVTRSGID